MILRPSAGISSRKIDIDVLSDWIEASVLIGGENISVTDVVDVLLEEEEIFVAQGSARAVVDSAWLEMGRRAKLCPRESGITVSGDWVKRSRSSNAASAHLFLLILSLATKYDWWHKRFGSDYNEQGRLFESVTELALTAHSPSWQSYSTGWRATKGRTVLEVAQQVANRISSGLICSPNWDTAYSKDMTLDLLHFFPFSDGRSGSPYFLVQCASGDNWVTKLKEPDLEQWSKVLNPDVQPVRGLSIPFCLSDKQFNKASSSCAGLLLDRCRLLGAAEKKSDWLTPNVVKAIQQWVKPRIREIRVRSA